MAFTPFQDLIPRTARKIGIHRQVEAAHVCEIYRKIAPEVVHKDVLRFTRALSFRGGALSISVENSAWANEIKLHEQELLKEFEKSLNIKNVKQIKTQIS